MTAALLQGENLRKVYRHGQGEVIALAGIDLTIAPGELVAIMGPSGCGKSTLLHLLAGIDTPTAGRVLLQGTDIGGLDAEERARLRRTRMGLLFQAPALLPNLTVAENVALPLALAGVGRPARAARATALLDLVGLAGRATDLPDDLSGGQRQRIALARALINDPLVVLADEPTGSLMVTHDQRAARRANRVIALRDGRIEPMSHQERLGARQEVTL